MGLDWFDNALHVFDRKANIKAPLTFVTVSKDSIGSKKVTNEVLGIGTPSQTDPEWVAFQVACVKSLDSSENVTNQNNAERRETSNHETSKLPAEIQNEKELELVPEPYKALLEQFPVLIHGKFEPGEPAHGVWHYI